MTLPEFKNLDPPPVQSPVQPTVQPTVQSTAQPAAHVGATLRSRRRLLELTLDQVATRAGCSESMLCKIETGKVNPSITLLRRLAQALQVNIAALFDDGSAPDIVQRAGKRPRLNEGNLRHGDGVVLERLIHHAPGITLQADIHEIAPGGASDGLITHQGEEMGYVLDGEVELLVDDQRWRLSPGDSFYFRSERPHGYRNIGTTMARILWVNTPATF